MILLDSSCWVEYFMDGPKASPIESYLGRIRDILVPSVVLYEVSRHLLKKMPRKEVLLVTAQMTSSHVVPLDVEVAMMAASLSLEHRLGMADSLIYATAVLNHAKLVTLDNDFRNLHGCVVMGS